MNNKSTRKEGRKEGRSGQDIQRHSKQMCCSATWGPRWTSLSSDTSSWLSSLPLLSRQAFVKQKTNRFKTHIYQVPSLNVLFFDICIFVLPPHHQLPPARETKSIQEKKQNHLFLLDFQANQGFQGNLSVPVVQALRGFLGHLGVREDRGGRESCCGIRREPG